MSSVGFVPQCEGSSATRVPSCRIWTVSTPGSRAVGTLRSRRGVLPAKRLPPLRPPGAAATPDASRPRGQAGRGRNSARRARQRSRQGAGTLAAVLLPVPRRRRGGQVVYRQHFALKHDAFERAPQADELFDTSKAKCRARHGHGSGNCRTRAASGCSPARPTAEAAPPSPECASDSPSPWSRKHETDSDLSTTLATHGHVQDLVPFLNRVNRRLRHVTRCPGQRPQPARGGDRS